MSAEALLALRYLHARRRRVLVPVVTAVSVLGVAVGVFALVVALALLSGFQEEVRGRILGATPHVHAHRAGDSIEDPAAVASALARLPGAAGAAPVLAETGLLTGQGGGEGEPVHVLGLDPAGYGRVSELARDPERRPLEALAREDGIVLGSGLAEALGVRRGGEVRLLTARLRLSPFGAPRPRAHALRVLGTFETGFYEYDRTWALLPLGYADRLFEAEGRASAVHLRAVDPGRASELRDAASAALGPGWIVRDWTQTNRALFSAFKLEKLLMFLAIGLIVLVAALNIVATLVLTVMERTRDIGILRALGATPRSILRVFVLQGFLIGLAGTTAGSAFGVASAILLDARRLIRLDESVYFLSHLPFRVRAEEVAAVAALALAVSLLATVYPALQAARLDPIEALRRE